ncbi:MAG: cupredoxin domain-containing protein [Dehalococcoidia bacterium]
MRNILGAAALLSAAMAAGCGGAAKPTPTAPASPTTTPTAAAPTATAAAPTATIATPTAAAVSTAGPPPPAPAAATARATIAPPPPPAATATPARPAAQSRTLVAHDVTFAPASLSTAAGVALTITLDNQDAGVQHDLVIFNPQGAVAAETALTTGSAAASVTFTPGPGTYAFKCSVHPQQMNGVLIVG